MNTTWIIIIAVLAIAAAAGTIVTALRQRAPRVPTDAELIARLRDRHADVTTRRPVEQRAARIADDLEARGRAPQRSLPRDGHAVSTERIWAGGF